MESKSTGTALVLSTILFVVLIAAGAILLPSWGKLQISPSGSVTVVGEATSQEKSQIAIFSAGVNTINDDKNAAINEVNSKVDAIITAVKEFGILAEDLKTQSINVYQNQEQYYEDSRQKMRPGQWNVSNTVEIKLRNVDQAQALSSILTKSGATNVYGPNFTFDDTRAQSTALFDAAYKNALEKADKVALSTGKKLGSVMSVVEGGAQQPVMYAKMEGGGGGGGAIEPGSGTVSKIVTVTFELK